MTFFVLFWRWGAAGSTDDKWPSRIRYLFCNHTGTYTAMLCRLKRNTPASLQPATHRPKGLQRWVVQILHVAVEGLHAHLLARTRQSCASAGPTAVAPTAARWDDWHCQSHLAGMNCCPGPGMTHQIQGGAFSSVSLSCLLGQSISPREEVLAGCTNANKRWVYTSYLDNDIVSARRRFLEEGSKINAALKQQYKKKQLNKDNWWQVLTKLLQQLCVYPESTIYKVFAVCVR